MASRSQRITEYSVNNVLKEVDRLEDRIKNVPKKFLEQVADTCKKRAIDNFARAEYAGPQEDIDAIHVDVKRTGKGNLSVRATGPAVNFIEFGTGVVGDGDYLGNLPSRYVYGGGPNRRPEGKDYWFFTAREGISGRGQKYAEAVEQVIYRDDRDDTIMTEEEFLTARKTGMIKQKEAEKHWRREALPTGSYITKGNPGNNCLYFAFDETAQDVPDMLQEYMK